MSKDFAEERREKLLEYITRNGRADVAELVELTQVAGATIRRDLMILEQSQLIHRTHGGAIPHEKPALWQTTPLKERVLSFEKEKDIIAKKVAEMIHDGDSIMIDGGSTTLAVAKHLSDKKKLLVITNTTTIGELLIGYPRTRVLITGGEFTSGTLTMLGPITEEMIKHHRTDKAIIGVSGMLLNEGLFAAMPEEAEIKRLMMASSLQTIVVADSSKIGTRAISLISGFSSRIQLVTDNNINKSAKVSLERSGVEVIIA